MKGVFAFLVILALGHECFSQQETFEKLLDLDVCSSHGTLWGNEHKRWKFEITSPSGLTNRLCEHILPKSTLGKNRIIISRNELEYFLRLDNVKVQSESNAAANPPGWEGRFGKQVRDLTFDKPLQVLIVRKNKLVKVDLRSLVGVAYHTLYPHGKPDVVNENTIPVVYEQKNLLEAHCPVLLVTTEFLKHIDLEKARVTRDTISFGTKDLPGTLYKTGIDFNGDGQDEVLLYDEEVNDNLAEEDDESSAYKASIIAMYFKKAWYRTSFWEKGPDGLEGF